MVSVNEIIEKIENAKYYSDESIVKYWVKKIYDHDLYDNYEFIKYFQTPSGFDIFQYHIFNLLCSESLLQILLEFDEELILRINVCSSHQAQCMCDYIESILNSRGLHYLKYHGYYFYQIPKINMIKNHFNELVEKQRSISPS